MRTRSDHPTHETSQRLRGKLRDRSLAEVATLTGSNSGRLSRLLRGEPFGHRSFLLIARIAEVAGLTLEQSIRKVAR